MLVAPTASPRRLACLGLLLLMLLPGLVQAQGFVIVTGDDADDSGHCQGTRCGGLYPRLFSEGIARSQSGGQGIVAVGVNGSSALSAFNSWNSAANGGPGAPVTHVRSAAEIASVDFSDFALIYVASVNAHTSGGLTTTQVSALNARQPDVADFVNVQRGALIALTQANRAGGWGFLPVPLTTADQSFTNATPTAELQQLSPNTTQSNLSHCCFHNVFTGPEGYSGLKVLAVRTDTGLPVILGGVNTILTAEICDDGIDNDEDGLVDQNDPDCQVCGDGDLDPGELCDDGNTNDGDGCSATCQPEDNLPPVAICAAATVETGFGLCEADATVDAGSYDPENAGLTLTLNPAGPFSPGTVSVSLVATDGTGASDSCSAPVTVLDPQAPIGLCNAPAALDGAVGSASFTAGAGDNCPATVEISDPACRDDDPDDDGVPDEDDECPDSDTGDVVVIAGCDTGVVNVLFPRGCTILDEVYICGEQARNHGEFVSCMAHLTNDLRDQGVITGQEKGEIMRCAAQAPIPLPRGPQGLGTAAEKAAAQKSSEACPVSLSGQTIDFSDLPGIGYLSWTVTATDASGNTVSDSCTVEVQNPSTTFGNLPPAAAAGDDQVARIGEVVALDGSGSMDLDGDVLGYSWSLTPPAGSGAVLSDPAAISPTFVVDVDGEYRAQLVVDDGSDESDPDEVVVRVVNRRPVADAGPDHAVLLGDVVTFDGSASFDADGDAISYSWALAVRPAGSAATLSDPQSPSPSLQADVRGVYVAQLVVDDGRLSSPVDASVVHVPNVPPVAEAGPDPEEVSVFDVVPLDGSGSSDFEGDPLSYEWTLLSAPAGSSAALDGATTVDPTITPDVAGTYVVQLVVSDGFDASLPDTVSVVTINTPPVADAGDNQTAFLLDTIQLDGSGSSDVDDDELSYEWILVSRPAGSSAQLSEPNAVAPTFVADLRGSYTAELVVFDGRRFSQPDRVTVAVINRAPVAVTDSAVNGGISYPLVLDGADSFDPDADPISYQWLQVSRPSGSTASLSRADSPRPFFTPDVAGTYELELVVFDGFLTGEAPVTVTVAAGDAPPNAHAGSDVTVLVGQSAQLDGTGSSDPEGQTLTYAWSFVSLPPGSALTDADLGGDPAAPVFAPDIAGDYAIELEVDDGTASDTDLVTVFAVDANAPPQADPGPDLATPSGSPVLVDGSASFDPDAGPSALGYSWALVSTPVGSAVQPTDLLTPSSPTTSFVPDVEGLYVLRLTVFDGAFSDAANVVVHADDSPPGLAFVDPTEGEIFYSGTLPNFEVSYFDQGVGLDLSSFQLLVDGVDVTADTTVTPALATYVATAGLAPGTYSAQASVADLAGNFHSDAVTFGVSSETFRAIADCSPTSGIVPLTVSFRSRGEFGGGSIVRYRWDFEGDGRFDTSDPVARDFTRTFTTGGTREAVLEVTNNFGDRVTDTCEVRVSGTPPIVTSDATPSNGGVPLTVSFTCDATDPDGSVALYEWDFEGDGSFDFSSPTSGATSHTYTTQGTFPARCRVSDADGLTADGGTINTTVRVGPPGTPSVTALATPTAGVAPVDAELDGTATDDGSIVLWEWDFDGNGTFDFASPTSPLTTFSYGDGGRYAAILRVTDNAGLVSSDAIEIFVDVGIELSIPDDTFDPSAGETVGVETTLSGGASVRVEIRDRAGNPLRTLFDGARTPGTHVDTWDGLDDDGFPLSHGPYFVVLEYDVGDETRTLDLTNTSGGTRYNPPRSGFPSSFSPLEDDLLEVTFTIPASRGASEVTAFIGLFNVDTRFVTLLERVPFGVGTHTIFWDGTAPSGGIADAPPGDRFLYGAFGFELSDNAIMLQSVPTLSDVSVEPNYFDPATPDFLTPDDPVAALTFTLDKVADVELTVVNLQTGIEVRRITETNVMPGTGLAMEWDGRADNGLFADKGDYRLTLQATDAAGASIRRFALVRVFY